MVITAAGRAELAAAELEVAVQRAHELGLRAEKLAELLGCSRRAVFYRLARSRR